MEQRKKIEAEHYDKKAKDHSDGFNSFSLSSFKYLKEYLKNKCQNKKVLDYCCGNGVHSFWLADFGAEVVGIDISEKSLEFARKKTARERNGGKVEFIKMDAEKLEFENNSFDIIFDGGSFSSLDLDKVYLELARVLKPNGFIIGIETFGHNPITNLKRAINKSSGKRTDWAVSHIFRQENFEAAKKYFREAQIKYFHLASWAVIHSKNKNLLIWFEKLDKLLLRAKIFNKMAFKVVFIFSNPKKYRYAKKYDKKII